MKHLAAILFSLSLLVGCGVIFGVGFQFTNDGPQHLLGAYVHQYYAESGLSFDETWLMNEPLTDHGFRELVQLSLTAGLSVFQANNVAVLVMFSMWSFGWSALLMRLGGSANMAPALVVVFFSGPYWFGLWPFLFSVSIVPMVILVALRSNLRRRIDLFAFAGLLLIQVHAHPFPAVLAGLCAVAVAGPRFQVFVAGAPAALLAALIADSSKSGEVEWHATDSGIGGAVIGDFLTGFPASQFLVFVLVAVSLISAFFSGPSVRRRISVIASVLIIAGALLPDNVPGWQIFAARFTAIGIPLALVCVTTNLWKLDWLPAFFCLVHLIDVCRFAVRTEKEYLSDFSEIQKKLPSLVGKDWEMHRLRGKLDAEVIVNRYSGWAHMPQLLAMSAGGRPASTQADDVKLHHLLAPALKPQHLGHVKGMVLGEWTRRWYDVGDTVRFFYLGEYFSRATNSDTHVIVTTPDDEPIFARLGIDARFVAELPSSTNLYVATVRGCSVHIDVDTPTQDVIEIGLAPSEDCLEALPVPAGTSQIDLLGFPCGRWWIRTEAGCTSGLDSRYIADVEAGEPTMLRCGPAN